MHGAQMHGIYRHGIYRHDAQRAVEEDEEESLSATRLYMIIGCF